MAEAALDDLIDALRRLPGVGLKSAQRMAFHLLQHDREGAAMRALWWVPGPRCFCPFATWA